MSIQPFWGSEFTQKRAQSPGNHIARLYKKNLDQKFGLDKKLEQFSEKKVRHPTRSTKSHWKYLYENPAIWPWSVRGKHQNHSISELRRSWASYRCMNTSGMSCKQRFWCLWAMQGRFTSPKSQKPDLSQLRRSLTDHFKERGLVVNETFVFLL